MNHLFQVTVYTGQQLVLEALQRWLQRPCTEPDVQRQRRASIKNLIVLLLKTAATGVLATILDAAIEYRRRQLLAAAEEDPLATEDGSASSSGTLSHIASSRFGLGPLSRAGIAAWKTRLLIAIDEMERQAHQYGIEPTMRFTPATPGKLLEDGGGTSTTSAVPEGKLESATAAAAAAVAAAATGGNDDEDRQAALAATVEQLQQLAKLGNDDAERTFEEQVDSLLDSLLGTTTPPTPTDSNTGVYSALPTSISSRLKASCSEAALDSYPFGKSQSPPSSTSETSGNSSDQICHICMDRSVGVQVVGCHHDLCFQCARRLCAGQDHALPQCPFCRQPINGFSSYTPTPMTTSATLAATTAV